MSQVEKKERWITYHLLTYWVAAPGSTVVGSLTTGVNGFAGSIDPGGKVRFSLFFDILAIGKNRGNIVEKTRKIQICMLVS